MSRFLAILALIVALVGLSAPSVSLGMGVSGPVWAPFATDGATAAPANLFSCKSMGGKRTLPCHPDLGVIAGVHTIRVPAMRAPLSRVIELPAPLGAPEAELPPPRRA